MCGIAGIIGNNPNKNVLALSTILSRGEVTETYTEESRITLTIRRLKIIDRENSIQPWFNPSKSLLVVFNGEIYNFRKIRQELEAEYCFRTDSDIEVLMAAYEIFGMGMLGKLRGQFAFLIFNRNTGDFFCARDSLGITPLYYVEKHGQFFFSSTISALTNLDRKIRCLLPGHYMNSSLVQAPYFIPRLTIKIWRKHELLEQIRQSLIESIALRVDTDLPVGVIYSGGIDSTIVLELAARMHPDVIAFTIGMPESEDFRYSRRFCREKGIRQVIIPFGKKDACLDVVRDTIRKTELSEYLDIINAVISLKLFKAIHRAGIKVVLGGDGSDELFAGYNMYAMINDTDLDELFINKLKNLHRTELQRVDRSGGAFSIETRVPFLDRRVVELALSIGKEWKIKHGVEKWCLRKAFSGILPDYIIHRKKNPLSFSSGIHERIRMKKITFAGIYNKNKYYLHESIRRDFSVVLRKHGYNLTVAGKPENINKDYSKWHHLLEFIKAFLRTYVLAQ